MSPLPTWDNKLCAHFPWNIIVMESKNGKVKICQGKEKGSENQDEGDKLNYMQNELVQIFSIWEKLNNMQKD